VSLSRLYNISEGVVDEAIPASAWKSKTVSELIGELTNLTDDLPTSSRASALAVIAALQEKLPSDVMNGKGDSGGSMTTMTKKSVFGAGM
jgi:hypothetical protein